MIKFTKWLFSAALALGVCAANAAAVETIDRMYTNTFGRYTQTYEPNPVNGGLGLFMLFSIADHYQLSDGSEWEAGAGWHPYFSTKLDSVTVVGNEVIYRFVQPSDGILFRNTDYNGGDHSSQGELGTPVELLIRATLGTNTGVMSGFTKILSNTETWYGDRFNHYSAPVGSSVFFSQTYTLRDTTFDADLFSRSFSYNEQGFVDFTMTSVPEPGMLALVLCALLAALITMRRRPN